ncbi:MULTISPECIES: hypothetical protein [Actinomadura]|uniref:Uncharacterized protein n=1 Tax=Actinomadura litoris TaxID=2678616 RepID=A0A7K1LCE3_9ACTN|nr:MULTISPECIES: hypothetical protein [Actinomadura]MBT2208263.1 hypothetical protein [Actinomadura sp. NEAU-AAG7]MUN42101.1 hypothetical protein [Actinomadura litoris]
MRPDGDPEPDDYGLPRVDVVVPDDARELERDMVAYRREERRRRRRERWARLGRPLTRFGVAIPIIAGALLVALLSGALMTAFGPRPAPRPPAAQLAPRPTAGVGRVGGLLPAGTIDRVDRERAAKPIRDLRPGVIGVVPPGYRCDPLVAELAGRANEYNVSFWLVADPRPAGSTHGVSIKELRSCAGTAHNGTVTLLEDRRGVLAGAYLPAASPSPTPSASTSPSPTGSPSGKAAPAPPPSDARMTAVFVQPDGVVNDVVTAPKAGQELIEKVKALQSG